MTFPYHYFDVLHLKKKIYQTPSLHEYLMCTFYENENENKNKQKKTQENNSKSNKNIEYLVHHGTLPF